MEENKKYFLFADECGDSNLSVYEKSFPVFTLCGIIVSREQIRKLGDIYSQALTFLLERAVFYVDDVNPEVGGTIDAMLGMHTSRHQARKRQTSLLQRRSYI